MEDHACRIQRASGGYMASTKKKKIGEDTAKNAASASIYGTERREAIIEAARQYAMKTASAAVNQESVARNSSGSSALQNTVLGHTLGESGHSVYEKAAMSRAQAAEGPRQLRMYNGKPNKYQELYNDVYNARVSVAKNRSDTFREAYNRWKQGQQRQQTISGQAYGQAGDRIKNRGSASGNLMADGMSRMLQTARGRLVTGGTDAANTYDTNNSRITELERQLKNIHPFYDSTGINTGSYIDKSTGRIMGPSEYRKLTAELEGLQAQNRMYERTQGVMDRYSVYDSMPNFTEMSAKRELGNPTREAMRAQAYSMQPELDVPDKLGMFLSAREEDKGLIGLAQVESANTVNNPLANEPTLRKILQEGEASDWEQLTDDEVNRYYYLYNTKGQQAAYQYLEDMAVELGRRRTEDISRMYDEARPGEKLMYNLATLGTNQGAGITALLDQAVAMAKGKDINPYSYGSRNLNFTQTIRGNTARDIDRAFGMEGKEGFTPGDIYQSLMSAGDSYIGAMSLGRAYTPFMGAGAAASKAQDLYNKGASNAQIVAGSLLSGVAEAAFEYISLDKFLKNTNTRSMKQLIGQVLSQGGVEASEEMATEVANVFIDVLNRRSQSEWEQLKAKDGWKAAFLSTLSDVIDAGMGGFISGGMMAGAGGAGNLASYNTEMRNLGDTVRKNGQYGIALDYARNNTLSGRTQELMAKAAGEGADAGAVGRFVEAVGMDIEEQQTKDAIRQQLEDSGREVSDKLVDAIYNRMQSNADIRPASMDVMEASDELENSETFRKEVTDRLQSERQRGFSGYTERTVAEQKENTVKTTVSSMSDRVSGSGETELKNGENPVNQRDASAHGGDTQAESGRETVDIAHVESVKSNGKMEFKLRDGRTVSNKDILYKSGEEALLYETMSSFGYDTKTANAVARLFEAKGNVPAVNFIYGVNEAINYGKLNFPADKIRTKSFYADLTPAQQAFAYKLGKTISEAQTAAAQAGTVQRPVQSTVKRGRVHYLTDTTYNKMTDRQKASTETIARVASVATGRDVYLFETVDNGKGERVLTKDIIPGKKGFRKGDAVTMNGFYASGTGKIYIDINAGNNGEGVMLWTMAHELTHFVAENAPARYKALADFLAAEYGKQGTDMQALARAKMEKNKGLSFDEAYEEVVADSMERMFTDTNLEEKLLKLARTDRTLFEKIRDGIRRLYGRIKSLYKDVSPQSREGRLVHQMGDAVEKMSDMFAEAITEASLSQNQNKSQDKFSMRGQAEETKNLVAVHNLSADKLLKAFEYEGLPMPSIAITKDDIGHDNFGPISFLFGKGTIDPKNRKNKVYSADAWTPVFPAVQYEADPKAERRIRNVYYDVYKKFGREVADPFYSLGNTLEDSLNRRGGIKPIIEELKDSTKAKNFYLAATTGKPVETIRNTITERMSESDYRIAEEMTGIIGEENLQKLSQLGIDKIRWVKNHIDTIREYVSEYLKGQGFEESDIKEAVEGTKPGILYREYITPAVKAYTGNDVATRTEVDRAATDKAINEAVNQDEYEAWLNDLLAGVEKSKGIYNGKEIFTNSGNRRSFSALHFEVTAENIVKAMLAQNGGSSQNTSGFTAGIKSVRSSAARTFNSIEDIRAESGKLKKTDSETHQKLLGDLENRLYNVISEIRKNPESFFETDTIGEILIEGIEKRQTTPENLQKLYKGYGYNLTQEQAQEFSDIVRASRELPVDMFEAKPERVVGWNEVAAAIIPDNTSEEIREKLADNGIRYMTYAAGNETDRLAKLNEAAETQKLKFQNRKNITLGEDDLQEYLSAGKTGHVKNAKQRILDKGESPILKNHAEFSRYVNRIYKGEIRDEVRAFGRVGEELADSIYQRTGLDLYKSYLELNAGMIKESMKKHIDPKEPGDIPLTLKDFENIPEMLNSNPAVLNYNKYRDKVEIQFAARDERGYIRILTMVSRGRQSLQVIKMLGNTEEKFRQIYGEKAERTFGRQEEQNASNPRIAAPYTENVLSDNDTTTALEESQEGLKRSDRDPEIQRLGNEVNEKLARENEKLKADNKNLKELIRLQGKVTGGKLYTQQSMTAAAKNIMKGAEAVGNVQELIPMLKDVYDFMRDGGAKATDEAILAKAEPAINWLMDHHREAKGEISEEAQSVFNYLKGKRIYISPSVKTEIESAYDSYNEFRQSLMGRVTLTTTDKSASSLDTIWGELSGQFPWLFDPETNPQNQLQVLAETLDTLKDSGTGDEYLFYADVARQDCMAKIFDQFFNLATLHTVADEYTDRINKMKAEHARTIAEIKESVNNTRNELRQLSWTETTDSRTVLAYALDSAAKNDIERKRLEQYKEKIGEINEAQLLLAQVRSQIKEMSFSPGSRDNQTMNMLKEEAARLANKINTYDKQLLRLEATKPLEQVMNREKERIRQRQQAHDREVLQRYRQRAADTGTRGSIRAIADDLKKRLLNPTERRYVPAALVNGIIEVANQIDPTGRNQDTRTAEKYRSGLEALSQLKLVYDGLKDASYDFSSEYSEDFSKKIANLAQAVGDTAVRDMSSEQLQDVYDIMRDIQAVIMDATKQIGTAERITNYDAGVEVINEMADVKKLGLTTNKVSDFFRNYLTNPMRAVKEMSGYAENSRLVKLFDAINEGRRKGDKWKMDQSKAIEELRSEDEKAFRNAVEKPFDFGLTDMEGKPLKISKMQAMQLVLTWAREQANPNRRHLQNNTLIPDIDLQRKGKFEEALDKAQRMAPITQETVNRITDKLSEWDMKFMAAARKIYAASSDAINETTMITKHRPVATEKEYIGYEVDTDYLAKDSDNLKYDATIEGTGALKSVKDNAPQPLIMRGLNAVLDKHMDTTAKIYGLMIPVRNWNKAFNVMQVTAEDSTTVKKAIRGTWGKAGVALLDQAVADVQSPRRSESSQIMNKIKSGFVASTLASNLSVWMKQAASYPTAGSILSPGALAKGLARYTIRKSSAVWAEIDEHTAQHWLRRQGLSTQELGEFNQSHGWQRVLSDKLGKLSPMNWIQAMDVATTAALWEATKAEVKSRGTNPSAENYWDEVTKLYDRVIEETQPMYDPLHRAEATKMKTWSNIIMFQTQPIQNSGILREAAMELRAAKKRHGVKAEETVSAGRNFRKAVFSQAASHLTFTAMTMLAAALMHRMNPYRDKETGNVTGKSLLQEFISQFGQNYLNAVVPVFGSYAVSAMEKISGASRYDVLSDAVVDKLNTTMDTLNKMATKPSMSNFLGVLNDVAGYFGVPSKNATNIINGIRLHVTDMVNGELGSFNAGYDRTQKQNGLNIYNALEAGDTEAAQRYKDEFDEDSKWKTKLKEIIADRLAAGEITQSEAEWQLKHYTGMDKWDIDQWNYKQETGGTDGYSKYDEFYTAVETGTNLKAVIKDYTGNGVSEKTLAGQITKQFKPLYKELSKTEQARLKGYLLNAYELLGYDREKKSKDIDKWLQD